MKKAWRLVSIQLLAMVADMLNIGRNKKKRPKLMYAGIIFFVLLLGGLSFFYAMLIGSGLKQYGCLDALPSLMMAITSVIIFVTTVFKVKGTLIGFRDYDMVVSLPVSTRAIIASRLMLLYAMNFLFVIIMMIPLTIAYGILARPGAAFYILEIIMLLFIPLIPIVTASIIGTGIAFAAARFRHSNIISIIISLVFLIAVMGLSFCFNGSGEELARMSTVLNQRIQRLYPLAGLYSDTVIHYDISAFLLFLGISAAVFLLFTGIVEKVFKKLNTLIMTGSSRNNYKLGSLKTSSPFQALYIKELKRFFSSTIYAVNSGFGIVMLTLAAVVLLFVDLDKKIPDPQAMELIRQLCPVFVTFCIVMTCSTMASISLEGKNLWIIKSLPIAPRTVYLSKAAVNLTVISPAVLDILLLSIALKLRPLQMLMLLLISAANAVFISFYGLVINLLMPNFNWSSETVVVKNSAAVMVTIFSAMAYAAFPLLLMLLIPSMNVVNLIYLILSVFLDVALYLVLITYGKRRYEYL